MATTLQHHCADAASTVPNPQLKRIVYSKYRELLGSYNNKANAIIDSLPSYMVTEDAGFHFQPSTCLLQNISPKNQNENYGPGHQSYEAPACVQNAMMTKDKKPFTYTPGGIDLSQIKSERMAKRLARNAQAEGATGHSQMNRPNQPNSPGGSPGSAAASMGAAAMGMPFQVLPPPPPPAPNGLGKQANGSVSAPPPPPPPAQHSLHTATLAPTANGGGSPSPARKSPSPATQRFEPPPMGFRPEIKIPPNPMASLRKVPPPVEKNTFWKDAYIKERSKSPMPDEIDAAAHGDVGYKMPSAATSNNNHQYSAPESPLAKQQQQQQQQQPSPSVYHAPQVQQQQQQQPSPGMYQMPQAQQQASPGMYQMPQVKQQQEQQNQQQQQQQATTVRSPEYRSVPPPQSPTYNVYTNQNAQRATNSPFKFAKQTSAMVPESSSPQTQESQQEKQTAASVNQSVPWRTQRAQPTYAPEQQQQQQQQQTNNFREQESKPSNVGSLYIAPLAAPAEPQAQHIVRQIQQEQKRETPIRQTSFQQQQQHQQQPQSQQQQQQPQLRQAARWMSSQPPPREQPEWVRSDDQGNIVPSSLQRIKSPPPMQMQQAQQQSYPPPSPQQQQQQPQYQQFNKQPEAEHQHQPQQYQSYQPHLVQGNGFNSANSATTTSPGLRLQINTTSNTSTAKERIIPIQLEQTPTYAAAQPNFNMQSSPKASAGYIVRSPNQFVDQGYNNFSNNGSMYQAKPDEGLRQVTSPTPQLNAPRLIQQHQQQQQTGTRIIPISVEGEGARGPTSNTPVVLQNDSRTTPVQSKSFRVLQKITDTVDKSSVAEPAPSKNQNVDFEPQLQRPQYARQMSAQQTRNSPTVEQMRRMQIGQEQQKQSSPAWNTVNRFNNDLPQQFVHASEQHVPEPMIYTGSAIPSRSFKKLQAITTPENADKNSNAEMEDLKHLKINDNINNDKQNSHDNQTINDKINHVKLEHSASTESYKEPSTTCSSSSSIHSEAYSLPTNNSVDNNNIQLGSNTYCPPFMYPYPYMWYPPANTSPGEQNRPFTWPYPYAAVPCRPPSPSSVLENANYPSPCAFYYPYPYPPAFNPVPNCNTNQESNANPSHETFYPYPPPHAPYLSYPYPATPAYTISPSSSNASSALPDIIITPSTDDVPAKVTLQHKIKVKKEKNLNNTGFVEIEEIATDAKASKVDHNLNRTNINQFSASDINTDNADSSDDSEETPKCEQVYILPNTKLRSIKSVANVQIYNLEEDLDDSDVNTIDGESDVFDSEDEEENKEIIAAEVRDTEVKELSVIYEETEFERSRSETPKKLNELEYEKADTTDEFHDKSSHIDNNIDVNVEINLNMGKEEAEYDLIAALKATKLQTQKIMEQSASYWGKPIEQNLKPNVQNETATESVDLDETNHSLQISNSPVSEVNKEVDASKRISIEEAKNNFWSTFNALEQVPYEETEPDNTDIDFWAQIEGSKVTDEWSLKKTAVKASNYAQENVVVVPYSNTPIFASIKKLPEAQKPDISTNIILNYKSKYDMHIKELEDNVQAYTNSQHVNRLFEENFRSYTNPQQDNIDQNHFLDLNIMHENNSQHDNSEELDILEDEEATTDSEKEESNLEQSKETNILKQLIIKQLEGREDEGEENVIKANVNELQEIQVGCLSADIGESKNWHENVYEAEEVEEELSDSSTEEEDEEEVEELEEEEDDDEDAMAENEDECQVEEEELEDEEMEEDEDEDESGFVAETTVELNNQQTVEEDEEIDFWAEIEKSKEKPSSPPKFDPTQYPQEPREVDTEEEIDFWAEIEENRRGSNDHINFEKTALFWSHRANADDKKFLFPIFTEPSAMQSFPSEQLIHYRGEEPVFMNLDDEQPVQQSNLELEEAYYEEEDEVEEPQINSLEKIPNHEFQCNRDFSTPIDINNFDQNIIPTNDICQQDDEQEDLEIKRNNYRKAMTFFAQPIEELKEHTAQPIEELKEHTAQPIEELKEHTTHLQMDNKSHTEGSQNQTIQKEFKARTVSTKLLKEGLPDLNVNKSNEEIKISVRDRVQAFETGSLENPEIIKADKLKLGATLSVETYSPTGNLSRNSSQRSESEVDEEDSGVTDMNRQLSETDTESDSFPELRKMSSYQRASTHSRLFKLLQEDDFVENTEEPEDLRPSRRKIVHNVSVTRRQNPAVLNAAETMAERRERLSLPLQKNISIDADNPSTPNSPASPILGDRVGNSGVSDKLVKELVQSLLLRSDSTHFKDLPMAKLQAAAKRALEEELDSLENTSVETTPVLTPNNCKNERNYNDYYSSWSDATASNDIVPSKAFRTLQEKNSGRKSPWLARCPRVLSSKTVNSDLRRVTESPEVITSKCSQSPECFSRESSINKWRKS